MILRPLLSSFWDARATELIETRSLMPHLGGKNGSFGFP